MFRCENMGFSYDTGDSPRFVFRGIEFRVTRGDKVVLVGYNGLGKTTIMRLVAGTREPTEGKAVLGHNVVPGYLSQEFAETIPPDLTVYRVAKNAELCEGIDPLSVQRAAHVQRGHRRRDWSLPVFYVA